MMLVADCADQPELLKGWWFPMIWHVEIQCSDTNQVCFLQLFVLFICIWYTDSSRNVVCSELFFFFFFNLLEFLMYPSTPTLLVLHL
jgi:hypothetical protein